MNSQSLLKILLLVFLCLIASSSTSARWHRTRYRPWCYGKLCRKCQFFVYSRGKRSTLESEAPKFDDTNAYDQKWTEAETKSMQLMLQGGRKETSNSEWKNAVFDAVGKVWENVETDDGNHLPLARFIHKRSLSSHTGRCRTILNTPCCRQINQATTYIGYRVRKN